MPHLSNRVTTTTRAPFAGIQPIKRPTGRRSRLPVSISGGLGGSRLPNIRPAVGGADRTANRLNRGNLGAQVSAIRRV